MNIVLTIGHTHKIDPLAAFTAVMSIAVFFLGLSVGSYLNVLIYRVPLEINTVKGHSFCPDCNHPLSWIDLFPVFSYLFLGRKCRYCKKKISPRYMLVELFTAIMWTLYYVKYGMSISTIGYLIFVSCLICIIFIDAKHMIIPDRFNVAIIIGGALMFFDNQIMWYERLIGFFVVSGIFLLIALISQGRAMGGGDIKFTAAAGLVLGWKNILLALFIAALIGAIVSVSQYLYKKSKKQEVSNMVPFGPYLAIGMIISSFFGNNIINWYFGII